VGLFNRILVPMDLEAKSEAALRYAARLAANEGAELIVLHVLTSLGLDLDDMSHDSEAAKPHFDEARQRLDDLVGRVVGEAVRTRTEVVYGDPVQQIQILATKENCDLLVITVKNRSRVGKLVMGSISQDILLTVDPPVLCVRPD